MFTENKNKKQIVLENNGLKVVVDYGKGKILEFSNKYVKYSSNKNRELFILEKCNKTFKAKDFVLKTVSHHEDVTEEIVELHYLNKKEKLGVKFFLISDKVDTIRVLYQVADEFKDGLPHNMKMKAPLFHDIEMQGTDDQILCPGCQFRNKDGKKIIMPVKDYQYVSDIRPSMAVLAKNRKHGFAIHFPTFSDLNNFLTTQNVNKMLAMYENEAQIRNDWLLLSADKSYNDTLELHITAVQKGWAEVFDRYRDYWSSFYDFREYNREDLKWFNNCAVHNFVFFYGSEGFDHKKMKIDVDKLLKDGDKFGGYDTVTIWNMYPRLGIDKRTQWDFYDDFPGGRKALREAVDKFHEKNVPVFLPYIPWDQGPNESPNTMGDEFAKITKETNADGWQLDTMYDLPLSFRQKLDKVRDGLVLTSQFHPTKKLPIEMITTSWNEFWQLDPMPEVDILRFLCPIHIAPQIGRWLRYEDKTKLIHRAMWGGAPIVIWQDIFGKWLPFGEDQKKMVKEWKRVYLKYKEIFQGLKPIPLYTTNKANLYCNVFLNNEESESIYSFYNDSDKTITGKVEVWKPTGNKTKLILGKGKCKLEKNYITVSVEPREVVQVLLNK